MHGYPPRFYQLLIATVALLLLSGALLAPTTLVMRLEWEVPWRLPGAARLWVVALHVFASYLLATLAGALWTGHMRLGWRLQRNRPSGMILVALWAGLAISGVGIFYLGNERLALANGVGHLILGFTAALVFFLHRHFGRLAAAIKPNAERRNQHLAEIKKV